MIERIEIDNLNVSIYVSHMEKTILTGKTAIEIEETVTRLGLPPFTSRQLCEWLYKKFAKTFDEMTNISRRAREHLNADYVIGRSDCTNVQTSVDGTKKYLFPAGQSRFVESAYIPDRGRATLCVSSQVGCKMGCRFCMTGKQGFQGQITASDILNQIISLPERETLTNIVYMGMGEPFDNLHSVMRSLDILTADWGVAMSPRRITVSTIGVIPGIKHFLEHSRCHLAVSMHSPFHEERKQLMPIENTYPIADIITLLRSYDLERQRRISFEYIMFKGINDSAQHVRELARQLAGLRCRMNLIRFHPIPGTSLQSASEESIQGFYQALLEKGIRTTVRASRGQDIFAACGLLSTNALDIPATSDSEAGGGINI